MNNPMRLPMIATVLSILALSALALPAEAASCGPCIAAQERCSVHCFGRSSRSELGACLIACDNAATACSCDEKVNLRSEDAMEWTGQSLTELSAACNPTTPCGTEYGSCASWSGYSNCGDPFCGGARGCGECDDFRCYIGPALKQNLERYRVCFNAFGQSCTEWQRTVITLGCSDEC